MVGIKGKRFDVLYQHRLSTTSAKKFFELVNEFLINARLAGYKANIACFAVAGPVENGFGYQKVRMTNTKLMIDTRELKSLTPLGTILLINDFEAISYAINVLPKSDLITLNKGKHIKNGVRAVLGAGTGLGKNILYYQKSVQGYLPIPSEGGHADLPVMNESELELIKFVKKQKKLKHQVCYEDVLSGHGLEIIYRYLIKTKYRNLEKNLSAEEISKTKSTNPCSKKTFDLFIRFYARCGRNFALDALARGGVYIAGGIAAKNQDSFKGFMKEFIKNDTYQGILENIPVHLIIN
jgi:glucokinase